MKLLIVFTLLISTLGTAFANYAPRNGYRLTCYAQYNATEDRMGVKIYLQGDVKQYGRNAYALSNSFLDYVLSWDPDFSYKWGSYKGMAHGDHMNKRSYNPRKYRGYVKFEWIHKDAFGEIDLLLPERELLTQSKRKRFRAFMIMTHMEDHWGGTIPVNCEILRSRKVWN